MSEALQVLANGGGLTVPGALNKFSVLAQRLIPRRIVPRLVPDVISRSETHPAGVLIVQTAIAG